MKRFFTCAIMALASASMFAGDYLTNTNQSIQFLRNPSRDASIGIDGVYYNPAGVSFLDNGWHLQFNWQSPHQKRDSRANYGPLFAANYLNPGNAEADGTFSRKYKGRVDVPIQPSLFLAYNHDKWSYQFGFGIIGGGGTCEFENGVGSFEALVGQMAVSQLGAAFGGYSMKSQLTGKSYYFGATLAAARKLTDNLSVSLGLRTMYAMNNYDGSISDITFRTSTGTIIPVQQSYILDCKQTGLGIAPILSIDYRVNRYLNLAARYEMRTRLNVKADASNNDAFNDMATRQPSFAPYLDGVKTRVDMPAMIAVGAQVSPIESLRLNVGYHHFFDVDTKQWNSDLLHDTDEITLGAEYDITDRVEVSAGYQKTMYNQSEANYSDLSFNLDSYSFGLGVGVRVSDRVKLNAAYFQTNYKDHTRVVEGVSRTTYHRENRVAGIGIDFSF